MHRPFSAALVHQTYEKELSQSSFSRRKIAILEFRCVIKVSTSLRCQKVRQRGACAAMKRKYETLHNCSKIRNWTFPFKESILKMLFWLLSWIFDLFSQYLESYLWPNFCEDNATKEYVMSIIIMLNEKFRERISVWKVYMTVSQLCHLVWQFYLVVWSFPS